MKGLTLFIRGQIRGGKNNYIVLRNGMHVPRKEWAKWRDITVAQLLSQRLGVIFDKPCRIEVRYFKGDLRRRNNRAGCVGCSVLQTTIPIVNFSHEDKR